MVPCLMLIVISFALILHFLKPRQAGAQLVRLALGLLFLPALFEVARGVWQGLGALLQVAILIIAVPVLIFAAIRLVFGHEAYAEMMGHLLYDCVRWLGRAVITILALAGRLVGAVVGGIAAVLGGR